MNHLLVGSLNSFSARNGNFEWPKNKSTRPPAAWKKVKTLCACKISEARSVTDKELEEFVRFACGMSWLKGAWRKFTSKRWLKMCGKAPLPTFIGKMVGAPWDGSLNNQPYIPLIYSGYLLGIRVPAFSLWSTIVQQLKARQTSNNSMFWKKEPWAMWRMPWWHPQTNAYQPDPNKNCRLFYILQSVPVGQYQDPRNPLQSHNTTGRQWTMGKHKWLCDHGRDFCSTGCFCSLMK